MDDAYFEEIQQGLILNSHYVESKDVPNIDLYMDQVTTFMDQHLAALKRDADDKTLTKTMINNYAKAELLPPPVKKKYSRDHLLVMLSIYYLKNILSITDIKLLLDPITGRYFSQDADRGLADFYDTCLKADETGLEPALADIHNRFEEAKRLFADAPVDDTERNVLERTAFVNMLGYDIAIRQRFIDAILSSIRMEAEEQELKTQNTKEKKG